MKMSKVRKPMFTSAKSSTQSCGWFHQRSVSAAMLPPQLGCHRVQFDRLLQYGIVAVPLHEIGSAHERAVLAGASVVVPQIEVEEVNRLGERRPIEQPIFA